MWKGPVGNAGEMYVEGPCLEFQIRYSGLTAGIPHLRHFRKLVPVSHLVKPRMFQICFVQQQSFRTCSRAVILRCRQWVSEPQRYSLAFCLVKQRQVVLHWTKACVFTPNLAAFIHLSFNPSISLSFLVIRVSVSRSQWLRGLKRRSAAARLLILWVRIPLGGRDACC